MIDSVALYHLRIPCRFAFTHAKSSRETSDVLLVKVTTDANGTGWGELLPRAYVTGESIAEIMSSADDPVSSSVVGTRIGSVGDLCEWLAPHLREGRGSLALVGGLELAFWDLLAKHGPPDLDDIVGKVRERPVGRCVTVGMEVTPEKIRGAFVAARLQKASAMKLKVGNDTDRDIECTRLLQSLCGDGIQLRLDGNGMLTPDAAADLFGGVDARGLHSIEEPFDRDDTDCEEWLRDVRSRFSIDCMADESVCSQADAERLAQSKLYQWFNVRIGKHGGLLASCRIRDTALAAGIGVVGGSMVGETSALTRASSVLLHRSDAIDYVEGLGQNRSWLGMDPFRTDDRASADFAPLTVDHSVLERCLVTEKHF